MNTGNLSQRQRASTGYHNSHKDPSASSRFNGLASVIALQQTVLGKVCLAYPDSDVSSKATSFDVYKNGPQT